MKKGTPVRLWLASDGSFSFLGGGRRRGGGRREQYDKGTDNEMQRPKKSAPLALPPRRRFRRPFIYLNWLELSWLGRGPRQEAYLKTDGAIPGFHMALCKCLKGERETGFIAARAASLSFSALTN